MSCSRAARDVIGSQEHKKEQGSRMDTMGDGTDSRTASTREL